MSSEASKQGVHLRLREQAITSRIGMGDMTELLGVSPRTLRFYEERGLVNVQRDRLGYRWYDARARRRLQWIVDLRRAGLGLGEIADMLDLDEDPQGVIGRARAALEAQAVRIRDQLAVVEETLQRLQSLGGAAQPTAWRAGAARRAT